MYCHSWSPKNHSGKFINIKSFNIKKEKIIKIMHVTNFNERFDGRLHYNTGRRINNGFFVDLKEEFVNFEYNL